MIICILFTNNMCNMFFSLFIHTISKKLKNMQENILHINSTYSIDNICFKFNVRRARIYDISFEH